MTKPVLTRAFFSSRAGLAALAATLALLGCGGGGSDGTADATGSSGGSADGSTQVAVSPTVNAPGGLSGNWQLTTVVEGQNIIGVVVPGSAVPTSQILTQSTPADATTYLAPTNVTAGGNSYTVSTNGNSSTITGPGTNFTLTINSFSFSNYQGCGTCGVNSTVSVTMNANYTASGTLDGQAFPATTLSFAGTLTWRRVN